MSFNVFDFGVLQFYFAALRYGFLLSLLLRIHYASGIKGIRVIYQFWKFLNFYFFKDCLFPILCIIFFWNFFSKYVRTSNHICSNYLLLLKKKPKNLQNLETTTLWESRILPGQSRDNCACSMISGTSAGNNTVTGSDPKSWGWTLHMVFYSSKHHSRMVLGFLSCQIRAPRTIMPANKVEAA